MCDRELAARLGCATSTVTSARARHGIPRFTRWTPETIALLGTMPDDHLAKALGRPTAGVTYERRKRRIVAWRYGQRPSLTSLVSLHLTEYQRNALRVHAAETGCSLSALVRRLLAEAGFPEVEPATNPNDPGKDGA
jgi:hypothetical protein